MKDLLNSEIRTLALTVGEGRSTDAIELAALASVVCGHLRYTAQDRGMYIGRMVALQSRMVRSWADAKGLRWSEVIDAYDAIQRAGQTAAYLAEASKPVELVSAELVGR